MLESLQGAGIRVAALQLNPESFGSWLARLGPWWRPRRVIADGKERWLIVQAYSLVQGWKDIQVWRTVDEATWVDEVVNKIKNQNP